MSTAQRVETALEEAIAGAGGWGCPPRLAAALHYAIFPGGHRIRPQLTLAVARACGDRDPEATDAAAAAIEMLHCASLVHDDLPCFDDAALRRGKPSVHALFGEPLAVLTGDALIILAFETLARAGAGAPDRLAPLLMTLARAGGSPFGLVAGQAWESEPTVPLAEYHQAKTGSLFMAATMAGAIAAGRDPLPFRAMGERLGEAYQVADDLLDALCDEKEAGKPTGQDKALERPNAVAELGVNGAVARLRGLVKEAVESVPECPGAGPLKALALMMADRLVPEPFKQAAA